MNIRKVLLIVPPAYTFKGGRDINPIPPLGLGYLAAVVEEMGIEVKILDALLLGWNDEQEVNEEVIRVGLSKQEIEEHVGKYDPDLVWVACPLAIMYWVMLTISH